MVHYPLRFWLTVGALVAVFVGLIGPWITTFIVSVSGFDTDDGKLVAVCAAIGAVFLFVHAQHTARERRPLFPPIALLLASIAIAGIAIYDRSDVQKNIGQSEIGGLAKVGWGLWLDLAAGVVLVICSIALLFGRNGAYGRRLVTTGTGIYTAPLPPQPPSVLPLQPPSVSPQPTPSAPVQEPPISDATSKS